MDLISIIVPVYNVEKYLKRCIDSIILQKYKNIEILLIDDGSTDDSGKICDEYATKDSRIRVFHKKNGGLSSARNYGIRESCGKYISFVDSDDYIDENMLFDMYSIATNKKSKIVSCSFKFVYDNGKEITKQNPISEKKYNFSDSIKEMNKFDLFDMSVCTKLFYKELFADIKFPEGKLSEDYFVMYKLLEKGNGLYFVSKPYYNYFQRTNSITKSKRINHDFERAAYEQMIYIENKYPDLKNIVRAAYLSSNLTVYDFYLKNRVKCPKNKLSEFKRNVKENYKYVKLANMYGLKKNIQFLLFMYCVPLYNFIFKLYKRI